MYCPNCGRKVDDDARYCRFCGTPLHQEDSSETIVQPTDEIDDTIETIVQPTDESNGTIGTIGTTGTITETPEAVKKRKSFLVPFIIIGFAVLAVIAVIIFLLFRNAVTIDLNDYLVIEAIGYEGYGRATFSVDWDAIEEDYGEELSVTDTAREEFQGLSRFLTPVEILQGLCDISLDKTSGLSNGDVISYKWGVYDAAEDYVGCRLRFSDGEYTVHELTELTTFDAFAGLSVEFSGTAPNGMANINYLGSGMNVDDFSLDKSDGLSNGDIVTVTINQDSIENLAENLGELPAESSKEFTVVGLQAYAQSPSDTGEGSSNTQEIIQPTSPSETTAPETEVQEGDFIFPNSSNTLLTQQELSGLTQETCRIAINEIYARNGRRFNDSTLQEYFDSKDWYQGTIAPSAFDESVLNETEKANINLLSDYGESRGWR